MSHLTIIDDNRHLGWQSVKRKVENPIMSTSRRENKLGRSFTNI